MAGPGVSFRSGREVELSGKVRGHDRMIVGPAWIDLQSNGFAGVDFNHPDVTPDMVGYAVRQMWATGVGQVLPTLITHSAERLEHLLRVLVEARRIDSEVAASVPGFHLEGPFISVMDGARGAHPLEHVCVPEVRLWRRLQSAAGGLIRLVTLAPELPGALEFIRLLRAEGVVPAIGHTMATRAQVESAMAAGAMLSTHLGNGCPQLIHRHENPMMAQLGCDGLRSSVIADGIHLPPNVLRTLVRAKTMRRIVLVTDAMAAAGAGPGRYTLGDQMLEVGPDQIVRQPGTPYFAGSALSMAEGVGNAVRFTGEALARVWTAASLRPAALLRVKSNARLVVVRREEQLVPVLVERAGRVLYGGRSESTV